MDGCSFFVESCGGGNDFYFKKFASHSFAEGGIAVYLLAVGVFD